MVPEAPKSQAESGSTNGIHTNGTSLPNDIPMAPLLVLSYEKIAARDPQETSRLLDASLDTGFFYLDLRQSQDGESILASVEKMFSLSKEVFDIPVGEKEKFTKGRGIADTRYFERGLTELFNVQKDDVFSKDERMPTPEILNKNRNLLREYAECAHAILSTLLNSVGDCLELPFGTLARMHRMSAPGSDQVRFTRTLPGEQQLDGSVGIPEHRDASSMSLLFNKQSGLQILPPGADKQWRYVRPLPGHAIVNLGDAMVSFTNGLLRSNPHRVARPYGDEGRQTRYSLVYFLRPENAAIIKRLEGSDMIPKLGADEVEQEVTARQWVQERFNAITTGKGVVKDSKHR